LLPQKLPPLFQLNPLAMLKRFTLSALLLLITALSYAQNGTLTDCWATVNGEAVTLDWTSPPGEQIVEFTVERSSDGIVYEKVKSFDMRSVSEIERQFRYTDHPETGTWYYRIMKSDFERSISFLEPTKINVPESQPIQFSVFPNPNSGAFSINLESNVEQIHVQLMSQSGLIFYEKELDLGNGARTVFFELQQTLSAGIYFLRVSSGELMSSSQIVVSH
jgi:hypothetical protein